MKKTLLILLFLFGITRFATAQDFEYGKITQQEMDMKKYAQDTSAHAVVLQEFGVSRIAVANDDNIKLMFEYHVKIKIFDGKGFDKGTVQIPVYNGSDNDSYESVSDITGLTFYKDDNGAIQKIELQDKKIYPVKENKHWANYKFALPGIRNGCVIEYKYRIESPYFGNFHSWHFQNDIPKAYSEYEVHIPAYFNYNASLKGFLKLTKNSSQVERGCFDSHGAKCDCSFFVYGMKDIPAFIEEEYMTSPKNFSSAINFELSDYVNPYTGAKTQVTKEWKDVDYELKTEPAFGSQIKNKRWFKDRIAPIISGKTTELEKAKAIYAYIQKLFKWNKFHGIYSVDGVNKALESHSGSVADINLALVNALNTAGLNASAVLLSTRDNGALNPLYPVLGDFDYVVARVEIGGQGYFLDATDPLLSFGLLPFKCLNDKGRVISMDKPSYWVELSSLPQSEKSTYSLDFTLQEDGKLKGTIVIYSADYEAYKKRTEIKKFNSVDEYVESLNAKLPKLKILKSEIIGLDSLEKPLGEKYDVEIDLYDKLNGGKLTFNPFFLDKITTNPFKLSQRSYPVDMGMPSDKKFTLTVHLPSQYVIDTPPQLMNVGLPNQGGKFITAYEAGPNSFTFSHGIQFSKSIYSINEYPYIKEFYNKIIQSEKAEMVFKKK